MDFGVFTIETPNTWKKIEEQGTDSYVGKIAIDAIDTLNFDLGWYSNTLSEEPPRIFERSMLPFDTDIDTTDFIFVENRRGIDPDKYKKNNIVWDTIDGRRAKIVFPIQSGKGTTGIYIDRLWLSDKTSDRFNLYGTDMNPQNEQRVLKALKTLKFYKKNK